MDDSLQCPNCSGTLFTPVYKLRPNGVEVKAEDQDMWKCSNCGAVHQLQGAVLVAHHKR